jgi:predicted DNA-binding transcriptional regulator YafY
MLELLQAHQRLTGAELAARLGVDERTVRRYAVTLAELGIPVTAARGRYGGYRLSPGHRLPPLMLSDSEALAVVLGLAVADRMGMTSDAPAAAVALAKIYRLLPARLAPRLAAVQDAVGFSLEPREAGVRAAPATLLALGRATRERRVVTLSYRSGRGSETLRQLDPYGLVFHSGVWYLVGRERPGDAIDTYRVDRVGAVDVGEAGFDLPEGFDSIAHVTGAATGSRSWQVEVLLETDVVQARQRLPDGELTETADGVLLRIRVERLDRFARVLAGLGWPFTIVRPDELRTAVADHAARLTACADRRAAGPV